MLFSHWSKTENDSNSIFALVEFENLEPFISLMKYHAIKDKNIPVAKF